MIRSLITSKVVLAVVALIPWVVGEIASMSGCAGSPSEVEVRSEKRSKSISADCLVYETASGRLITVKAPNLDVVSTDCTRI